MSVDWWKSACDTDFEPMPDVPDGMRVANHAEIAALYKQAKKRVRAMNYGASDDLAQHQSLLRRVSREFTKLLIEAKIFVEGM